jgi:hypothetical protein
VHLLHPLELAERRRLDLPASMIQPRIFLAPPRACESAASPTNCWRLIRRSSSTLVTIQLARGSL